MPNLKKHAQKEMVEAEVQKQLGLEEWDAITDPFQALANAAGKAEKMEEILLARIEKLDTLRSSAGQYGEQIDVEYQALERAIDRYHRLILAIAKLDLTAKIAQMSAAVDSATAQLVKTALDGALAVLNLSQEDRETALRTFGTLLREQEPQESPAARPQIAPGPSEVIDVDPEPWEPGDDD
jgi:hypothetical protein